jgi:Domain of unknown function DUF11
MNPLRSRARTSVGAAAVAAIASIAFADSAAAALTVSQVESADPVSESEQVTYTMTVGNTGPDPVENVALQVTATKTNDESPVDNPYLSLTPTQGSCTLDAGSFSGGRCALGTLAVGASSQVTGVVQANFSMANVATVFLCDPSGQFCFDNGTSTEKTTVVHGPSQSGSNKVKIRGMPADCASGTFKARAKAKPRKVRSVLATISGPRDEYGVPLNGYKGPRKLAKKKGRRVKAKVKAGNLRDGFYELIFHAQRKGKPTLKRTATFQVC